jgi:uncharacterized protein (DUF362 family)
MKSRRDFLKTGLALGASLPLIDLNRLTAAEAPESAATPGGGAPAAGPILVAVRDGPRPAMLDKAMSVYGGMGAFVKQGQTVVIKPNISFDAPPERGSNVHPDLLRHVVELCFAAGAKSVSIFDHTLDSWQGAYEASGANRIARETGAHLVPGNDSALYRQVELPRGVRLRSARVHELVLDSDVFINVPVLKHHGGALMTACMKNLMGVVWDRRTWHRNDLHQCIADFLTFKAPALNILDAYHPMVRNGPHGRAVEDVVEMRTLLVSTDAVAIDAAASRMLGHEPGDIRHVKLAAGMNLGTMDLSRVDIRRFKLG